MTTFILTVCVATWTLLLVQPAGAGQGVTAYREEVMKRSPSTTEALKWDPEKYCSSNFGQFLAGPIQERYSKVDFESDFGLCYYLGCVSGTWTHLPEYAQRCGKGGGSGGEVAYVCMFDLRSYYTEPANFLVCSVPGHSEYTITVGYKARADRAFPWTFYYSFKPEYIPDHIRERMETATEATDADFGGDEKYRSAFVHNLPGLESALDGMDQSGDDPQSASSNESEETVTTQESLINLLPEPQLTSTQKPQSLHEEYPVGQSGNDSASEGEQSAAAAVVDSEVTAAQEDSTVPADNGHVTTTRHRQPRDLPSRMRREVEEPEKQPMEPEIVVLSNRMGKLMYATETYIMRKVPDVPSLVIPLAAVLVSLLYGVVFFVKTPSFADHIFPQ